MRGRSAAPSRHGSRPSTRTVAGVGAAVALEDLDRRGLARAVRAEQAEHLARGDVEAQAVDRAAVAVALLERDDLDRRCARPPRGRLAVAPGDEAREVARARRRRRLGDVEAGEHRRAPRATRASMARSTSATAPVSTSASWIAAMPAASRSGSPTALEHARARGASAAADAAASSGVSLPSRRSSPTGLPVTAGSPNTPSRSSRIWNASPSGIPKCDERHGEVVEATGERGAEVQRALHRVLARLVALDQLGVGAVAAAARGAGEVEELPDAQLDAQLVVERARVRAARPRTAWSA